MYFARTIYCILWCLAAQSIVVSESARPKYIQKALVGFQNVQGEPQVSIINTTLATDSVMLCSSVCMQRRSCSLYYIAKNESCFCNHGNDNSSASSGTDGFLYGEINYLSKNLEKGDQVSYPRDCLEHYEQGRRYDGIYVIQPMGGVAIITWCDMTNGGWTVIQRRQDGSENFLRNWTDYVDGFGNKCGEYWLGLDSISLLTTEPSELYISLETFGDVSPTSAYASYSSFSVGNSSTNYKLSIGGFEGSCEDGLAMSDGMPFTTIDVDNDPFAPGNCARRFSGAWWYNSCHRSNLNGLYLRGQHSSYADGVNWVLCWDFQYSLKKTEMKTRRL